MSEYNEPRDEGFDWEGAPDLTSASEEDLKQLLEKLAAEERDISYRRRLLQGRIDLVRSELVRRGAISFSAEELAKALMGSRGGREQ